jgi:hypothetical protein
MKTRKVSEPGIRELLQKPWIRALLQRQRVATRNPLPPCAHPATAMLFLMHLVTSMMLVVVSVVVAFMVMSVKRISGTMTRDVSPARMGFHIYMTLDIYGGGISPVIRSLVHNPRNETDSQTDRRAGGYRAELSLESPLEFVPCICGGHHRENEKPRKEHRNYCFHCSFLPWFEFAHSVLSTVFIYSDEAGHEIFNYRLEMLP